MKPQLPDSLSDAHKLLENSFKTEFGPFDLERSKALFLSFANECQKAGATINDFHFSFYASSHPFPIFLILHIQHSLLNPQLTEDDVLPLISLYLEHGGAVDAKNAAESTPLHFATGREHLSITQLLIENHADINQRTAKGDTILHHAVKGDSKLTEYILSLPDLTILEALNLDDETPLIVALSYDNIPNAMSLLNHGASLECDPEDGNYLHWIGRCSDLSFAKALIERGMSLTQENFQGETPLDKAAEFLNQPLLQLLIEQGYPSEISIADLQQALEKCKGHFDRHVIEDYLRPLITSLQEQESLNQMIPNSKMQDPGHSSLKTEPLESPPPPSSSKPIHRL